MNDGSELSSNMEDYIEAIYLIISRKGAVLARDIAEHLNVSRPSVTGALQTLVREKLVNHEPYDVITLTERGREIAEKIILRHRVLKMFFGGILGVDEDEAERTACAIEHVLSADALARLSSFVEFVKSDESIIRDWNAPA